MTTPTAAQTQQNAAQQNLAARQYLLRTGTPMRKYLGRFGPFAAGTQMQQRLLNVGILTSLDIDVVAEITITAAATPSAWGPYNFIRNITFNDYTNQARVNVSHRALQMILSARHMRAIGFGNNTRLTDLAVANNAVAPIIQLPTAIVAPVANNFRVSAHIPIAYDPANNLKGAIFSQIVSGDQILQVQLPTAGQVFGATDDAVYTAGVGAVAGIFVDIWQNYIQPVNLGAQPILPLQDLITVYELATQGQSSSDIAVGAVKYINYPNAREVLSAVLGYNNGTAGAGNALTYAADISALSIQLNANTTLREYLGLDLLEKQRHMFGSDLPPGYYYLDSRRVRINTVLYGQVQILLTPSIVTAAAYTEATFESFYLKGTALPGISTGA